MALRLNFWTLRDSAGVFGASMPACPNRNVNAPQNSSAASRSGTVQIGSSQQSHVPKLPTRIGGFWILDAANMDEVVAWGRKAIGACRVSVEVPEFLAMPTDYRNSNFRTRRRK